MCDGDFFFFFFFTKNGQYFPTKQKKMWRKKNCGRPTGHNYGHPLDRKHTFFVDSLNESSSKRLHIVTSSEIDLFEELSPYSTGNGVRVGYPTGMKSTHKKKMYMANARNLRLAPNTTHIPLTGIGGNANVRFGIGGNAHFRFGVGCFRIFIYQHVGIPKAKLWRWGCKPTPGPNANGFASQWNIGLRIQSFLFFILYLLYNVHNYEATHHQKTYC